MPTSPEYNRKHWERNKSKISLQRKLKWRSDPSYRKAHIEKYKEWAKKNPEKVKANHLRYYERPKRLRFEIFQRDKFTCQYCGRKAPSVILEIDHILPKSKGGKNNPENYATACCDCNRGKGDCLLIL